MLLREEAKGLKKLSRVSTKSMFAPKWVSVPRETGELKGVNSRYRENLGVLAKPMADVT